MRQFFGMLKTGTKDFFDDECMVSGAALAYYTVFALPPLLVLVFFLAGQFGVSEDRISELVSRQIGMPTPEQSAEAGGPGGLASIADRSNSETTSVQALGPASKVAGILLLVFSATGVFAQLQRALNRAWEVEPDPESGGWLGYLTKRVLSLGMIVAIVFLLLVSLVLTTLIDEAVRVVVGYAASGMATAVGVAIDNLVTLGAATLLFAAMFKVLPDADIRWKDMWVGAFITALLFVVGKNAIGYYLQNSDIGSAWGSAAASMIALLVWVYYTSLIVLYGAELTQAWASRYGAGIVPAKNAVRVVEERRRIRGAQMPRAT